MPPQNPQNQTGQRDADGYLHTPETMPQQPQSVQPVTVQQGHVEVRPASGETTQYTFQSAQPLQPLTHKPDDHPLYPAPAAAKPDDDPYSFFMEGKPAVKNSPLKALGKASKLTKIVAGATVAVLLLIGVAVIIGGSNKTADNPENPGSASAIVLKQQEILRVGALGDQNIQSGDLENFTETAISTTTSAQQQLISYIKTHGGTFDDKQLEKYVGDSKTDETLNAAQAASTYDVTYRSVMKQLLTDYAYDIAALKQSTASANTRVLMERQATNVSLLQTMLNSGSTSNN